MAKKRKEGDGADGAKGELKKRLESKVIGMMLPGGAAPMESAAEGKPAAKPASKGKASAAREDKGAGPPAGGTEKEPSEKPAKADEKAEGRVPGGKKSGGKKAEGKEPGDEKPGVNKPDEKESMDALLAQREEVETLLASIEDSYRDATLPDTTYEEVKGENQRKLGEINSKIAQLGGPEPKAPAPRQPAMAAAEEAPLPPEEERAELPSTGRGKKLQAEEMVSGLVKQLEDKIEERLKGVISSASVEVTDKRVRMVGERLDAVESDLKDLKKTAQTVEGFDKQISLISGDVEKAKAVAENIRESKNVADDKMQRLIEGFAEIRSIVYQREATSKEMEVGVNKLKDTIAHIDTARMLREFTIRDEQLKDVNTRLEKLERSGKMMGDTMAKIKGLLTDVGSLENVIKASKMAGEKLDRMTEIENRMRGASSKLEGTYVEMKKKLDEFSAYKVKQDKIEGMSADIMKNVEDLTRRLSDFVTKEDLDGVRRMVKESAGRVQAAEGAARAAAPPEAAGLQEEKEGIETLLATLDDNLKNKEISQKEYDEMKQKNVQRLAEIEKRIQDLSKAPAGGKPGAQPQEETRGSRRAMMLAKLRESYENGEISRAGYQKAKRLLMGK